MSDYSCEASRKPRVLFVSRERFRLPLSGSQQRKWDAISDRLDYRVLAAAKPSSPLVSQRFRLASPTRPALFDGALYYTRLQGRIAHELREFQPNVGWVQGVHEAVAFLLARARTGSDAKLILDVQGDWRATTRLYGSKARMLLNPLSDMMGRVAVRRADGIRTLSTFTTSLVRELGVEPIAEFPPFVDTQVFLATPPAPLPDRPRALFVGVLERYKGFDTLADAWAIVRTALPDSVLHVVGEGTLAPLAQELAEWSGSWHTSLSSPEDVATAIDRSTLLCLPSRAEGLGRVVIEAMCRGRAVVGGDAGGIPDVVDDGGNAVLVAPDDPAALAEALLRVLGNRDEAERLGLAARQTAETRPTSPADFAADMAATVSTVLGWAAESPPADRRLVTTSR